MDFWGLVAILAVVGVILVTTSLWWIPAGAGILLALYCFTQA